MLVSKRGCLRLWEGDASIGTTTETLPTEGTTEGQDPTPESATAVGTTITRDAAMTTAGMLDFHTVELS